MKDLTKQLNQKVLGLLSSGESRSSSTIALCKNSLRAQLIGCKGMKRVCSVPLISAESNLIPHAGFCHQGRVEICFNLAVSIPTPHPGVTQALLLISPVKGLFASRPDATVNTGSGNLELLHHLLFLAIIDDYR